MGGVFHSGALILPNILRCSSKRSNIDGIHPTPASSTMVCMVGKRSNTPPAIMSYSVWIMSIGKPRHDAAMMSGSR